jgi:hypothetical protein
MKPGRNLRFTAKPTQVPKGRQESLLGCVSRIVLPTQHPICKRKYTALPASHYLAKSLRITCQSSFYDDLVGSRSIHSMVNRARELFALASLEVEETAVEKP